MKKKAMALGLMALTATACITLSACNPDESKDAVSFVSLDINPAIELTLDKNDKVVSVYGANEDGQVLLYGETGIVGADVEIAVDKITALAIELGYLDESNKVIQTSVTAEKNSDQLLSKVNAKITASASDLNLSVSVSGADAYSLLRKLNQLKEKYPDNEAIQSLTPERFKLVVSASEAGDITIEAAVNLDTDKLVKMISDAHKNAKEFATQSYNKAIVLANDAYNDALGAVTDGIYTAYYTTHHPLKAYYGFSYQGYKTAARGLDKVADALEFVEDMYEYPLEEAQIQNIAALLGVADNIDVLKNSDGEITISSIEAYADKTFKNSEANEQLEEIKSELTSALATAESTINAKIKEVCEQYAPQIQAVANSLNTIVSTIEALIPSATLTQFTELKNDLSEIYDDIAQIIADGKINSTEIRALANKLQTKSNNALSQIENDLTDDELKEIAEIQKTATDSIQSAKTQLDEAIAEAEQSAKSYLQNLKNQRKGNA